MQPIDVVSTIRWIESVVPPEVRDGFFQNMPHPSRDKPPDFNRGFALLYAAASTAERIKRNTNAVEVLAAFGLSAFLDPNYVTTFGMVALGADTPKDLDHAERIVRPWRTMTQSANAWEQLAIVPDLRSGKVPDDVISMEIRRSEGDVSLATLVSAFGHLDSGYSAMARVYTRDVEAQPKLEVISIQTGSPTIRLDCRGLAGLIKELRLFIIEAWHKIRHKRSEELIERNSALLSTLAAVGVIEAKRQEGTLGPEDAENLKRTLVDSALGLFACNALPTEVRRREAVDNERLLSAFAPKLLTAGDRTAPEAVAGNQPKPKARRTRRKKQQTPTPIAGETTAITDREDEDTDIEP